MNFAVIDGKRLRFVKDRVIEDGEPVATEFPEFFRRDV